MAQTALVDDVITAGERLLKKLDDARLGVAAAYWLFRAATQDWILVLAAPDFGKQGQRRNYAEILAVFSKYKDEVRPLMFDDITAISTSDPILQLLRRMVRTGPAAVSRHRMTGNVVNGTLIEDVLVYRLADDASVSRLSA